MYDVDELERLELNHSHELSVYKIERNKIATAGFNRAQRDHSSKVRAKQFLDILKNELH